MEDCEIGHAIQSTLQISAPGIDFDALRSIYGWSSIQHQTWIRGELTLTAHQATAVSLTLDHVLEFWLDGRSYFGGDFYGYGRAPLIIVMNPGRYCLDVRALRDVRAMGGVGSVDFPIRIQAHISKDDVLFVDIGKVLLPEIVEGRAPAGLVGAIPVQNHCNQWLELLAVQTENVFFGPI